MPSAEFPLSALPENSPKPVEHNGFHLVVIRSGEHIYAYYDRCPHGRFPKASEDNYKCAIRILNHANTLAATALYRSHSPRDGTNNAAQWACNSRISAISSNAPLSM